MTYIVHNIEQAKIDTSTSKKIAEYQESISRRIRERQKVRKEYARDLVLNKAHRWTFPPKSAEEENAGITKLYEDWMVRESEYYSLVRIVERNNDNGETAFYLVYGNDDNATDGSGGFKTKEGAESWFTNQGR